jgi:AcrR family transcriptional regulator
MDGSTAQRGRPRSAAADAAILRAAFDLIAERGWAGFSIEGAAERAGVAKTTVYRRWKSRAELACDAFFALTEPELRFPDVASAADAFRVQILALADLLRGPVGDAFAAMLAGARSDPAVARAMAERWVLPRKRWGVERLARAAAEGQTRDPLDVDAALNALYSPLYAPLLMGRGVEPPERVSAYLVIVLPGIFKEP